MKSPKPIIGKPRGGEPQNDQEHFIECPACGRRIDMRDLAEILEHERACNVSEAPPPHLRLGDGVSAHRGSCG